MREEAVRFGKNDSLVGILSLPEKSTTQPVVLFLNAGMIHHVGPSRIYVRMARKLAALGFASLRFDFSGVGDSYPRTDSLSIDRALVGDTRQAMDYLEERLGISAFILCGHCGGSGVALLTATDDERVRGAILINPEGGEEDWVEYDRQRKMAQYHMNYYVKEAFTDPQRWKKLLTGKASYRNIFNTVAKNIVGNRLSAMAFKVRQRLNSEDKAVEDPAVQQQRLLADKIVNAFVERQIGLLLLFSKGSTAIDHTHNIFGKRLDLMFQQGIAHEFIIANADHMFTMLASQQRLMDHALTWCASLSPQSQLEMAS